MAAVRIHCDPAPDRQAYLGVRPLTLHGIGSAANVRQSYRRRRRDYPSHIARALVLATFAAIADRIEVGP